MPNVLPRTQDLYGMIKNVHHCHTQIASVAAPPHIPPSIVIINLTDHDHARLNTLQLKTPVVSDVVHNLPWHQL